MEHIKAFGKLVKIHRRNCKLTQEQLAELCDISTRQLGKIESGKVNPKLNTVIAICQYCKINIGNLAELTSLSK